MKNRSLGILVADRGAHRAPRSVLAGASPNRLQRFWRAVKQHITREAHVLPRMREDRARLRIIVLAAWCAFVEISVHLMRVKNRGLTGNLSISSPRANAHIAVARDENGVRSTRNRGGGAKCLDVFHLHSRAIPILMPPANL